MYQTRKTSASEKPIPPRRTDHYRT